MSLARSSTRSGEDSPVGLAVGSLAMLRTRRRHPVTCWTCIGVICQRRPTGMAARKGWADVAAGRYTDVGDAGLEDLIGQLGLRATRQNPPER